MREIEFLPEWYPQTRRRRRNVMIQAWATVALIVALTAWGVGSKRGVEILRADRDRFDRELTESHSALVQLDEQLDLKQQLQVQDQILAKIGLNVDVPRLLTKLDTLMPREMSLIDVSFDTFEQKRGIENTAAVSGEKARLVDRTLKVRLTGVAPSDVDLANFLTRLSGVSFFSDVRVVDARDRAQSDHLMRQFEVTFAMSLNTPGEDGIW